MDEEIVEMRVSTPRLASYWNVIDPSSVLPTYLMLWTRSEKPMPWHRRTHSDIASRVRRSSICSGALSSKKGGTVDSASTADLLTSCSSLFRSYIRLFNRSFVAPSGLIFLARYSTPNGCLLMRYAEQAATTGSWSSMSAHKASSSFS